LNDEAMRSVGTLRYGGPDLLRVLTEERPAPDDRRVLIAVELGTVNPADLQLRSGGVGPHISGGPPYIGAGMLGPGSVGPRRQWADAWSARCRHHHVHPTRQGMS
jgi:hypothetical protein